MIEAEGTFGQLQNSDNVYAKSLTEKDEVSEEDEHKSTDSVKISRQISTRVSLWF